MLAAALEAEVDKYMAELAAERDERGTVWWFATATTGPALSSPRQGPWRSLRLG